MPAVARILARYDRNKVAAFIAIAIDLLDTIDGDAEAEPGAWPEDVRAVDQQHQPDDAEAAGDERDAAWLEWTSMHARQQRLGACRVDPNGQEDDEPDDPPEDDDPAGQCDEEGINTGSVPNDGAGCPISDPGDHWTQTENVPMPEVFTAEHNIFNDRRTPLGIVNLQSSYRTNGETVRSADSGNAHQTTGATAIDSLRPGTPV